MPDFNADALVILLIEDEAHIRRIVRQILFRIGVRNVYEAADGGDGFMQVLRVKPHVVLCDIHMAPVDGITFLETLRAAKVGVTRRGPKPDPAAQAGPGSQGDQGEAATQAGTQGTQTGGRDGQHAYEHRSDASGTTSGAGGQVDEKL